MAYFDLSKVNFALANGLKALES